jgi:hypothetical protein
MTKRFMKLTVPGKTGYIASVDGSDAVSGGGPLDDLSEVTAWLLTKLAAAQRDFLWRSRAMLAIRAANDISAKTEFIGRSCITCSLHCYGPRASK